MSRPINVFLVIAATVVGALAAAPCARAQQASTAADAARSLAAALAKGDSKTAATFVAASDRDRFTQLMQASDQLAQARSRFRDSASKLSVADTAVRFTAPRTAAAHPIDHIHILGQREVDANTVELLVKGFGADGRSSKDASTWQAVRENGQWRIHLPPCVSPAAMAPILKRYQDLAAATDRITATVQRGQVTELGDAHIALFKAEHDVLRGGAAQ